MRIIRVLVRLVCMGAPLRRRAHHFTLARTLADEHMTCF